MRQQHNFVELVVACGSWQEAQKIADVLLEKHLVASVEFMEIKSKYWWKLQLDEANEIKLIMTSVQKHFEAVEKELKKHHSYETFVLQAIPLVQVSEDAAKWLATSTELRLGKLTL
ncbi:MAG: divalent cation tolerance protein CutA [Candidatus Saccharimonadales bacterium]